MNSEHLKIRDYGKAINQRARQKSIEEKQYQGWHNILEELNIEHIN